MDFTGLSDPSWRTDSFTNESHGLVGLSSPSRGSVSSTRDSNGLVWPVRPLERLRPAKARMQPHPPQGCKSSYAATHPTGCKSSYAATPPTRLQKLVCSHTPVVLQTCCRPHCGQSNMITRGRMPTMGNMITRGRMPTMGNMITRGRMPAMGNISLARRTAWSSLACQTLAEACQLYKRNAWISLACPTPCGGPPILQTMRMDFTGLTDPSCRSVSATNDSHGFHWPVRPLDGFLWPVRPRVEVRQLYKRYEKIPLACPTPRGGPSTLRTNLMACPPPRGGPSALQTKLRNSSTTNDAYGFLRPVRPLSEVRQLY